ncbi:unnamed protein product [Danaus chrysippus]|uniref:(African queen) hypothetical protein n=1 Tax=Danaus chrysippus TaxID=151541 RepID=A0A8J2QZ63_9NEOP|nr:unnamed protein product [Danaus chrysippus]
MVTWFQVLEEWELPRGLCCDCSETALTAYQFRQLCKQSDNHWRRSIELINKSTLIPHDHKTIYISYADEVIYKDDGTTNSLNAAARFNTIRKGSSRPRYKKHVKINGETKCRDCGKKFPLPYYLNRHLKSTPKRACTQCGEVMLKEKLAIHLETIHRIHVFYCDICYQLFNDINGLGRHKEVYHKDSALECKVCRNGFTSDRSLAAHMYSHTLFNCSSCNRAFENRKCYIYHKGECTGRKSYAQNMYECHDCGSKYSKKPSLRIHIVQKHLNILPFVCQTCGKRCSTKNHLRSHELVHKTERQVYECYCGAKMRSALGFEMHQRIHSGEKPYVCEDCGDRFLSASRRLDHIKRKHRSKELAHGCDKCDAKFVRPFELKKHYRSVHLINILREELYIPKGICIGCSSVAISAFEFRLFTRNSVNLWKNCINTIDTLPKMSCNKSIYAILRGNMSLQVVNSFNGGKIELVEHLSNRLTKKKPLVVEKKPRHPRTGPACTCVDCGKAFLSPYYLNLHLRNSGQKEACWLCGAMVVRGSEMKEHLSMIHKTDMILCPDCPTLLKSEQECKRHLKKCHGPGNLTCADCGRTFQRQTSFEVHTQMHTVRTCRACGAQFTNRGCYREHRSKCEPDAKPDRKSVPRSRRSNVRDPATFTCDYCSKTYHSRPQLKNHIMWIHMDVRPHQCQWCGKRFYTPARLAEHMVVHTRVRNFECDICGAKLVSKMAAVYHRRRHTGERPYECQDCGERFISSSRRSEHAKRRHNRGLRFQCPHCHASFVRSHELKKHTDKVHNDDLKLKDKNCIDV